MILIVIIIVIAVLVGIIEFVYVAQGGQSVRARRDQLFVISADCVRLISFANCVKLFLILLVIIIVVAGVLPLVLF